MAIKITYIVFIGLYSILMICSVIKSQEKKEEKNRMAMGNTLIFAGSILMFLSIFATIFRVTFYFSILLSGFILTHIGALINGFKIYGKPHLKHHLARMCISLLIMVLYYFANIST